MLLYELLSGLEYKLYGISADADITSPFSDSRAPVFGGLFVCLSGREHNGEDHIREAKLSGARACVTVRPTTYLECVVVEDTRHALAVIWHNYYKRPGRHMRFFGITGTNGKTSTACFLASCLRESGRRVATVGTLGAYCDGREVFEPCGEMTTPPPEWLYACLQHLELLGVQDVVMEVSSHGAVQRRVDAIRFYMTLFTNLSPEHLDFHSTMDEYFRAKASFVSRGEIRVVNADDLYCRLFAQKVPSVEIGMGHAENISVSPLGVKLCARLFGERIELESSVGGDFMASNILLAAAAARKAGVRWEDIKRGIANVGSIRGRLERVALASEYGFDIFIDYAHTPAALEGVLRSLRPWVSGSLVCVFGCGGMRDREKRPLMGRCAETYCDKVVVTSDNSRREDPREIISHILSGMKEDRHIVIEDREKAVMYGVLALKEGDCLLLAGKGHETYELSGGEKRHFDEREIVKRALSLRNGK